MSVKPFPRSHLLGTLQTRIAGAAHHPARPAPGAPLRVEREPANPHEPHALAVKMANGQQAGYVHRGLAAWMAPLLDRDWIAVTAQSPRLLRNGLRPGPEPPLELDIFLCGAGRHLLSGSGGPAADAPALVHGLVAEAWRTLAARGAEGAGARATAELLAPLAAQAALRPETRMLLALMSDLGRQAQARAERRQAAQAGRRLLALRLGGVLHGGPLAFIPLFNGAHAADGCLMLDEALAGGLATIEELGEGGSVPFLLVTNRSPMPLLAPEGFIVRALKQTRVINESVVVAPHASLILPVSCVEQGRWHHSAMAPEIERMAPPRLRSDKLESIKANRRHHREAHSDQGAVWDEVACYLNASGAASPTHSLSDAYRAADGALGAMLAGLKAPEGAVGIVAAVGTRILGMELLGHPAQLARGWQRLAESYAFDALRGGETEAAPASEAEGQRRDAALTLAARRFVERVAGQLRLKPCPAGAGVELTFDAADLTGSGVWLGDRIGHLSVFDRPH